MNKKLFRTNLSNRVFGGVAGGVAKYIDMDPTIIRIMWALLTFCYGVGGIAYIICWILMPGEESKLS
jgi:phage shock protein PspC (stress-responsive transcriptional regulator)